MDPRSEKHSPAGVKIPLRFQTCLACSSAQSMDIPTSGVGGGLARYTDVVSTEKIQRIEASKLVRTAPLSLSGSFAYNVLQFSHATLRVLRIFLSPKPFISQSDIMLVLHLFLPRHIQTQKGEHLLHITELRGLKREAVRYLRSCNTTPFAALALILASQFWFVRNGIVTSSQR